MGFSLIIRLFSVFFLVQSAHSFELKIPNCDEIFKHVENKMHAPQLGCIEFETEKEGEQNIYFNSGELAKKRKVSDPVKKCRKLDDETTFKDVVSLAVRDHFSLSTPMRDGYFAKVYNIARGEQNRKVSLLSHPMCKFNSDTLRASKKPDKKTIEKANRMIADYNRLRDQFKKAESEEDKKSILKEISDFWTIFMGSLAITESLGNPDTKLSKETAEKVISLFEVSGYKKPDGVKFYHDKYQTDDDSKYNIGLYQFSPKVSGNINLCIKNWESKFSCKLTQTTSDMVKTLGAEDQVFNTFCGVNKIVQTFDVQINAGKVHNTHPDNVVDGKLKEPKDRCVTPFIFTSKAYAHFGPLQNSTEDNMRKFLDLYEKTVDQ